MVFYRKLKGAGCQQPLESSRSYSISRSFGFRKDPHERLWRTFKSVSCGLPFARFNVRPYCWALSLTTLPKLQSGKNPSELLPPDPAACRALDFPARGLTAMLGRRIALSLVCVQARRGQGRLVCRSLLLCGDSLWIRHRKGRSPERRGAVRCRSSPGAPPGSSGGGAAGAGRGGGEGAAGLG